MTTNKPQEVFTIYNASAGSGKTFTLVVHYLCLILDTKKSPHTFKKILAITFTNKAVNELKRRILEMLKAFASHSAPDELPMFTIVKSQLEITSEDLQKQSQIVLKKILHNYSFFNVNTIDAFNSQLIRTFSRDLNLPLDGTISLDIEQYIEKAISAILDEIRPSSPLLKPLVLFATKKIKEGKSDNISKELLDASKIIESDENYAYFKKLLDVDLKDFQKFQSNLRKDIKINEKDMQDAADAFFEKMQRLSIEKSHFSGGSIYGFFEKVKTRKLNDKIFTLKYFQDYDQKDLYTKTQKQEIKQVLDAQKSFIKEKLDRVYRAWIKKDYAQNLYKNSITTIILSDINKTLLKIKDEEGVLFLWEFNKLIYESVKNQPAPFIYERLGSFYKYFFIDEFQDTSSMQWHNLLPLIENAISGEDTEGNTGQLFLVGDAKQSIYRFRGGYPEQFIGLYNHTSQPFQIPAKVHNLEYNFRSDKGIVAFNNSFFKHIAQYLEDSEYRKMYAENSFQKIKKGKKESGYVDISFVENKEYYFERTAQIILDLKAQGWKAKDICILADKKDQLEALATYFSEIETPISVATSEALLLKNDMTIDFINNILRWLKTSEDGIYKMKIASYLTVKNNTLLHTDLYDFLENFENNLSDVYGFDRLKELQKGLYDIVLDIVKLFELSYDNFLQTYQDIIFDFVISQNTNSLYRFLDYWDKNQNKFSATAIEDENSVKMMTIHKSKGLEFPIVVYSFANSELIKTRKKAKDFFWEDISSISSVPYALLEKNQKIKNYSENHREKFFDGQKKEVLDNINKLYVALTRAENQLYIISELTKIKSEINHFSELFKSYLEFQKKWSPNQLQYTFGEKTPPIKEEKLEEKTEEIISRIEYRNHKKLTFSVREDPHDAIKRGIKVHHLMERLDKIDDVSKIKNDLLADNDLSEEEINELGSFVDDLIESDELKKYYSGEYEVFNEMEILTEEGNIVRPDKIFIKEKEAVIVDFKTGEKDTLHQKQMNIYGNALENLGYKVKIKYLVYGLRKPQIMKVNNLGISF